MPEPPTRILLAKIGLDGHDRGVKVLARVFRDAGFEVIYTGLWQTCQTTMHAALQEDVDIVGVSLLSAAHMTVIPELLRFRKELDIESIPVILGGIVPAEDHAAIRQMGVAAIFNPGSATSDITQEMHKLAADTAVPDHDGLIAEYLNGSQLALSRLITYIQRGGDLDHWTPPGGQAVVIGITGSPGVGKSSFIGKLGAELRGRDHRVAVIAVDPTSPITGGALLGDRLRMMHGEPDDGFFVRSIASSDVQGGLGPLCPDIIRMINGFGFDVILVETVGAGQSDVSIREIVDHVALLLMPESGDYIQFSKAGIMEIATHFIVNKCDLDGADATHAKLLSAIGHDRPVWQVSTVTGQGIPEVADWVAGLSG